MSLFRTSFLVITIASSASTSAFAGAAQWMGGANVSFSPNTQACTGLVPLPGSDSNAQFAVGSNTGLGGYNTGFAAYNKSSAGGGGFVFVFEEPYVRTNGIGLEDIYNRKFVVSALSGGVAGLFFPNVAITGSSSYYYPSVSFSGTDLVGSVVVNYTASGTSCQMTASFIGIDAGGVSP